MAAELIFEERFVVETVKKVRIVIFMDLYKLKEPYDLSYSQGYRFSWIAFEEDEPSHRVLFDSHPPKGPHMHIDMEKEGISFEWKSIRKARRLFFQQVVQKFGPISELEGES